MGLPGDTLDDFYERLNMFQDIKGNSSWLKTSNLLVMLPDSPMADPEYVKKHDIKVAMVGTMENEENTIFSITKSVINGYKSALPYVVSTYSYTPEEWEEMFFINRVGRVLGPLIKKGHRASDFFKFFYAKFKEDLLYLTIKKHLRDITTSQMADRDIGLIGTRLIEEVIFENYIQLNTHIYDEYLHIPTVSFDKTIDLLITDCDFD